MRHRKAAEGSTTYQHQPAAVITKIARLTGAGPLEQAHRQWADCQWADCQWAWLAGVSPFAHHGTKVNLLHQSDRNEIKLMNQTSRKHSFHFDDPDVET